MDLAYRGYCLNCQKPIDGQSYCDYCADGDGKSKCPECGERFKSLTPLSFCWQHENDISDLREICAGLQFELEDNRKLIESTKAQTEVIRVLAKKIAELAEEYRKFIEEQNGQNRTLIGGGRAEHGRQ